MPDDSAIKDDLPDVIKFKEESLILAKQAFLRIKIIESKLQRLSLLLALLLLMTVWCVVTLLVRQVSEDTELLMTLYIIASVFPLIYAPKVFKDQIAELKRVEDIFYDFYLSGLRIIKFRHGSLKLRFSKLNPNQSKSGFEASWKCINCKNFLD